MFVISMPILQEIVYSIIFMNFIENLMHTHQHNISLRIIKKILQCNCLNVVILKQNKKGIKWVSNTLWLKKTKIWQQYHVWQKHDK